MLFNALFIENILKWKLDIDNSSDWAFRDFFILSF